MKCNFTYDHYREILNAFRSDGYDTVSFTTFEPGKKYQLLLRHDIDFLSPNLLFVTNIEKELGFHSINHFLITSELYNLNSKICRIIIAKLRDQHHYIGLHVDPIAIIPEAPTEQFQEGFKALLRLTEVILGEIESYSFHRPAMNGSYKDLLPEHLPFSVPKCAYDTPFFKDIIYRSDSRREWRNGCICKEIKKLNGQSIQLLIHPNWWDEEDITRDQNLQKYIDSITQLTHAYLSNNLSFYPKSKQSLEDFFLNNKS